MATEQVAVQFSQYTYTSNYTTKGHFFLVKLVKRFYHTFYPTKDMFPSSLNLADFVS